MSVSLGQCKHFRGVQHDECEAGMLMSSVKADNPAGKPFRVTWACLPEGQHIPCALRAMPTPEEIAADRAEVERICAAADRGECPTCVKTERRKGGGYVARCPSCPEVSIRACSSRDIGGAR